MDGYATDSFWQRGPAPPDSSGGGQPHGPFDVCVIGAGIAGLSTAYHLTRAGSRVLVLDRGPIGAGQTARTTAHLSCVIDDRFVVLERLRGAEIARLAAQSHAAAIDSIEQTAAREQIDCGFKRVDAYLMPHRDSAAGLLLAEEDAARRAGLTVERVKRAPFGTDDSGPCLRFAGLARFDPRAYMAGLCRALVDAGATILPHTPVESISGGVPASVRTEQGVEFDATAVVVATNAAINSRVALPAREFPHLSYVVALKPPENFHDALYWDTDEPYHYVRLAERRDADGSIERAILVGGEDHPAGRDDAGAEQRFQALEAWTRRRLPGAGEVIARWSGQVVETLDGLAYIGPGPGERNVYVATGDSGMGITHGTIAGLLLTELIAGRGHPWAAAYDPARWPRTTLAHLAQENLRNSYAYRRWLHGKEVPSVDAIAPGSGAVIGVGPTQRAVYRDEAGELHELSAVCPHLGGVVCWNALEHTWDCPVHGSRFDCLGHPLQGPANAGLRPRETAGA